MDTVFPDKGQFGLDGLAHFGFDGFEIVFGNRLHVDVVVKPVLDRRADGQLGLGVQVQDGLGHDMGGAVPQDIHRFGVPGGDQADAGVLADFAAQVHHRAVQLHGHAVAGQPLGNPARHGQAGGVVLKLLYVSIGKCYVYHRSLTSWPGNLSGRDRSGNGWEVTFVSNSTGL